MTYEFCQVHKKEHILTVTINRPERMNALHPPANAELNEVFDDFFADDTLWVAIITGAGDRAFCAGNDLRFQAEGGKVTMPEGGFGGLTNRTHTKKPIIAAVNGVAMGGGFEIALSADLIVASATARFALPEPRVGLAALAGGLHRLPRQIPLKQAMGMILTGRTVAAQEGQELGFVNEIAEGAQLMDCAQKWADMILSCSPVSVQTSKTVVGESLEHGGLTTAMHAKYAAISTLVNSADFVEGPKAFAEKRLPKWTGR